MFLSRFKIFGHSMEPTIRHNQIVLASSIPFIFAKPRKGDIVIVKWKRCIIKRIVQKQNNKFFVIGDNEKESTDSREFGWVDRKEIAGKVILKI